MVALETKSLSQKKEIHTPPLWPDIIYTLFLSERSLPPSPPPRTHYAGP